MNTTEAPNKPTEEPKIDKRKFNGGKRQGAGKPKGCKNNTYNRVRPYQTKTPHKKIVDLIGNHKLKPSEAAKILGVTPDSVYAAMQRYKIDISRLDLDKVKSEHESELIAINALARGRIYDKLVNSDDLGLIEMTAVLDRTFQQIRELQGKGHTSVNIFTTIVQRADEDILKVPVKVVETVQNKAEQATM